MKLRHYLRGLGIGMAVTAMLLHFSVYAAEPSMTDEEVMARARELGMIENIVLSRNDPTISGGNSISGGNIAGGEAAVSASGNAASDGEDTASGDGNAATDGEAAASGNGNTVSDGEAAASGNGNAAGNGEAAMPDDGNAAGNGEDAMPDDGNAAGGQGGHSGTSGNGNASDGNPSEEDIKPAAGNDDETETEPREGMSGAEAGQDSVTITVTNGDSSVSVAAKLAALGLVSSQAEYDAYLCSHGYDRTIRTGVHVIPVGATEQQIAEIITSKQ